MKKFLNSISVLIGLGLVAYSYFTKTENKWVSSNPSPRTPAQAQEKFERWNLKPGSVYDGDTLRVTKGSEELKIRFCGIDAPEKKQTGGIESRDFLRSLIDIGNGELLLVPIERDRYGRTVAEVYVQSETDKAIPINLEMIRNGHAWHYAKYSGNCPMGDYFAIAEQTAKQEGLGLWNGNPQPPWEWRKQNK